MNDTVKLKKNKCFFDETLWIFAYECGMIFQLPVSKYTKEDHFYVVFFRTDVHPCLGNG